MDLNKKVTFTDTVFAQEVEGERVYLDSESEINGPPDITSISAEELSDEVHKGIHAEKSYVGMAFLALLLYYLGFYFTGLICNLVFIAQANTSRQISGSSPSGRGCLIFLIWFHLIIPIIILLFLFLGGGLASLNL